MATERKVDGELLLREIQTLLEQGVHKLYSEMARVDRVLRGKGYPESVCLLPVSSQVDEMNKFLVEMIEAEIEMWKNQDKHDTNHRVKELKLQESLENIQKFR